MDNTPFSLDGKLAIVTGGGTGLGLAISRSLIEAGARVLITGRREHVLADACKNLSSSVEYRVNDVTELDALPGFVEHVETEVGPIDILVNNAGINLKKHALQVTDEEFATILKTNLQGVFSLSREVGEQMAARKKGAIINITSMAAIYGIPQVTAYSASKTGALGLTRALAADLSPDGVRVNAIAPGFIDTPMSRKAFDSDPERKQKVLSRTPMRKLGLPEDVGYAAVYLASDASKFITGINLRVDGGNSIGF